MDTKTEKLISVLDELVAVLESDGEEHWSQWMRDARARLADSDPSGMTRLRSAYGGMGSFNDLVLGAELQEWCFVLEVGVWGVESEVLWVAG